MDAQVQAPSPFLPDTNIQFAFDSTSLGYLKTCAQLYKYIMIDGWHDPNESVHLRFGQELHQAFQDYDRSRAVGIPHNDALHDVIRELLIRTADFAPDPDSKAGKYKNRSALVRAVIWYLDEHRDDPAKTYIMQDGKPAVELSFRFELDWGPTDAPHQPYLLCGHLDRVVEFSGALYVMDHKTTYSQPSTWYFTQYHPDNQMTLYTIASRIVIDSPIRGVIINAIQLQVNDAKFGRGFTYRTPDEIEEWLTDLHYWFAQAEHYAKTNHWPKNDKSCNSYRSEADGRIGCPFREACSKSPQVREQFLKSDFTKLEEADRWNPLKSRI